MRGSAECEVRSCTCRRFNTRAICLAAVGARQGGEWNAGSGARAAAPAWAGGRWDGERPWSGERPGNHVLGIVFEFRLLGSELDTVAKLVNRPLTAPRSMTGSGLLSPLTASRWSPIATIARPHCLGRPLHYAPFQTNWALLS